MQTIILNVKRSSCVSAGQILLSVIVVFVYIYLKLNSADDIPRHASKQ